MLKKIQGGLFIVFEGCDGCGKTTVAKNLLYTLKMDGYDVIYTRDPGRTTVGEKIRGIVKEHFNDMSVIENTLLYTAARISNFNNVIMPALDDDKIVICDRYIRSTYVYQHYYDTLPNESSYELGKRFSIFTNLISMTNDIRRPDFEFVINTPPEVCLDRCNKRGDNDSIDSNGIDFYREICQAYINSCSDAYGYHDKKFREIYSRGITIILNGEDDPVDNTNKIKILLKGTLDYADELYANRNSNNQ